MAIEPKRANSALIEAANRAEATALLIRCGCRVYRPEADVNGEDLVIRDRDGQLRPVQLRGRAIVDAKRYGGRELLMLFPSARYKPGVLREWFLVPHDHLFDWIEPRRAPGWNGHWSYPTMPMALRDFLAPYVVAPPAEPEGDDASRDMTA